MNSLFYISAFLALFPKVAFSATIQTPTCEIIGDADVYGPGVRYGFYLQWAAMVIFLVSAPEQANIGRSATAVTALSVLINFYRNVHEKALISLDWLLLWYITLALIFTNFPLTQNGFKKSGGSAFVVLIILATYYLSGPYILFKAWNNGRQPGCDVKDFIYTPISVYSRGWLITFKVVFCLAVLSALIVVIAAIVSLVLWIKHWGDKATQEFQETPSGRYILLGIITLCIGAQTIAFAEKTIHVNHVTFPNTKLTDSGQLIALLIGIFTFISSVVGAIQAVVLWIQN